MHSMFLPVQLEQLGVHCRELLLHLISQLLILPEKPCQNARMLTHPPRRSSNNQPFLVPNKGFFQRLSSFVDGLYVLLDAEQLQWHTQTKPSGQSKGVALKKPTWTFRFSFLAGLKFDFFKKLVSVFLSTRCIMQCINSNIAMLLYLVRTLWC